MNLAAKNRFKPEFQEKLKRTRENAERIRNGEAVTKSMAKLADELGNDLLEAGESKEEVERLQDNIVQGKKYKMARIDLIGDSPAKKRQAELEAMEPWERREAERAKGKFDYAYQPEDNNAKLARKAGQGGFNVDENA